jgi:hypothetical protein
MDYNISCLKHGMPLKMQDLGCNRCHQEALAEIRTRLNVAETFADAAAKQAHRETKREYFEKVRSQAFWDAVVTDDGPEGRAYALQALECIQTALRRKDG